MRGGARYPTERRGQPRRAVVPQGAAGEPAPNASADASRLRAAREAVRHVVAGGGDEEAVRGALHRLVEVAWAATLSEVAACAIVAAAIELGAKRRRAPATPARAAVWEAAARARYAQLADARASGAPPA
jgi:hypothetical protein